MQWCGSGKLPSFSAKYYQTTEINYMLCECAGLEPHIKLILLLLL